MATKQSAEAKRTRLALPKAGKRYPFCNECGWRKGGIDSWNGHSCKCGHTAPSVETCGTCGGLGTVPYNIGSQPCPTCDGSGLK